MIHAMIVLKNSAVIDLLLMQGANPNAMSLSTMEEDKVCPCYLATTMGWFQGLHTLVQAGGNLLTARGEGVKAKTVLHAAAERCHFSIIEYITQVTRNELSLLLDHQGKFIFREKKKEAICFDANSLFLIFIIQGNTALHYAAASGHTGLVSYLIGGCGVPVHQESYAGELPLHWAARHGRLEVVCLFVEKYGCNVNAHVPRKLGTPFDLAKAGHHKRVVDYLKSVGGVAAKKVGKKEEISVGKAPKYFEVRLMKNGLF
ncbi:ankyrin repeat-containing domain protein [Spinellus fusiger]|nr:ankyrin repeat-containing domain protein [Spinellus fusiger]